MQHKIDALEKHTNRHHNREYLHIQNREHSRALTEFRRQYHRSALEGLRCSGCSRMVFCTWWDAPRPSTISVVCQGEIRYDLEIDSCFFSVFFCQLTHWFNSQVLFPPGVRVIRNECLRLWGEKVEKIARCMRVWVIIDIEEINIVISQINMCIEIIVSAVDIQEVRDRVMDFSELF